MSNPNAPVPVQELSYAVPAAPRHTFSWLAFFSTSFVMGLVAFVLLVIVPSMKEFYRDVHLQLPFPTEMLVAVSDWATAWGWESFPIVPVVFALIAPRVAVRTRPRAAAEYVRRVDQLTVLVIVLGAGVAVLFITLMFGFMAMITLTGRTSR
ncbi:MAG TPA: hypothetical protein VGI81_01610 [Tepidisphaeraceae bacterium]|jgi:hypothetical protein